jgi:hypothetical protein
MQYPGTIDNWYDQSGISAVDSIEVTPRPIFLTAAAFDRGPESITTISGANFYKTYGYYIDFDKYGQAAIQAANIINNGGELMIKRIVAEDATLANIVVVANVTTTRVQKVDSNGRLLYLDPDTQQETTKTGNGYEKVMINVASIKYDLVTIEDKKTIDEISVAAMTTFVEDDETDTYTYPLFVITDIGRGESTKRFGIEPQYNLSKNLSFMIYKFKYLGSENLDAESVYFAPVPGVLYLSKSMDIEMASTEMIQCNAKSLTNSIEAFYSKLSEISGLELTELYKTDVLFGKSSKGSAINGISIDSTGADLGVSMGFNVLSGDNGAFGNCPIDTDEYAEQLIKFYGGEFDEDIYNLDMYKPDVCVDCNYPYEVKKKIVDLADFRKDFFFFGDLGLDINTYENASNKVYEMPQSKFAAWYGQSYKIMNPFTYKNIDVTIGYDLSTLLIPQLNDRRNAPYCGIMHGFTIPNAIEGSINFTPKITPSTNQKVLCEEERLNYASILKGVLTLETELTSQEEYTQLSFINNVIAIQKIIKTLREECPSYRYSFMTTDDLTTYKKNIENILSRFTSWFETLEMVYIQDDVMKANKVFEADLRVKHKDFIQSEIFNIYTLGTEDATIASTDTSVYTS